jgi:hypothetical protein
MNISSWLRPNIVGWWVWVLGAVLVGAYLAWLHIRRPQQSYTLIVVLGIWVLSIVAHYLRSNWHQYVGRPRVWLSGVAAILPVSLIPLVAVLVVERSTRRVVPRVLLRCGIAVVVALVVTLFVQEAVAVRTSIAVMRYGR